MGNTTSARTASLSPDSGTPPSPQNGVQGSLPNFAAGATTPASLSTMEPPPIFAAKPTLAVIGGGIAGLHAALELTRCGFEVTVLEARSEVASGSVLCAPNCINALFDPHIFDAKIPRMFFFGLMKGASTGILSRETNWPELFSRRAAVWAKARLLYKGDRDKVRRAGSWLAAQSAGVFRSLAAEHPAELASALHVTSEGPRTCNEGTWSIKAPGEEFLFVDAARWGRGMRSVLEQSGVKILTRHRIESIRLDLVGQEEHMTSILVSDSSDPTMKLPQVRPMVFDAYVLCAGSSCSTTVGITQNLPIWGLKGYALRLLPTDRFAKLVECPTLLGEKMHMATLSSTGFVHYNKYDDGHIVVAGLGAIDSRDLARDVSVRSAATKLSAHSEVLVKNDAISRGESVLVERNYVPRQLSQKDLPDDATPGASATTFTRSVTPDGLPFVAPLGAVRNAFICAGFGDNELRWAPASAVLLRKFVLKEEKDSIATNPFSMRRFRLFSSPSSVAEGGAETSTANATLIGPNSFPSRNQSAYSSFSRFEEALASPTTAVDPLSTIEEQFRKMTSVTFTTSVLGKNT